MGRYLEQNEGRSELQQRIAAELRAKAEARAKNDGGEGPAPHDGPDGVDDAAYLNSTKVTTTLAPAWAVIGILGFVVLVYFIYQISRH